MKSRRHFLKGLFGATLALPLLETFAPKQATANAGAVPPYAIFIRQANGVVQTNNVEPQEMFWPSQTGILTKESLAAESDRTLSELADYASRMICVKGVNFSFPDSGCGHSGGGNQCMTAARVSTDPAATLSLAMGESIDNRIARELNAPGVEPLTLYAGKKAGFLNEVMSYRGEKQLRSAQENPYSAYMALFGLSNLDQEALKRLSLQRASVNDLVREQMTDLLSRGDLAKSDRDRLDLHFQSIRDLEVSLACKLGDSDVDLMASIAAASRENDNIPTVTRMQMDIIALAMACGVTRAATLQIGDGNDSTQYVINGVKQKSFHRISHRVDADGGPGPAIDGAQMLHHEIDRLHARHIKYMVDKLAAYDLGTSSLLDYGVVVWLNDLADLNHVYKNVPYILVGGAAGYLKTGQFIDLGGVANNKLLNTIGAAMGCKNAAGGPLDDFGDPSLPPGLLSEIIV